MKKRYRVHAYFHASRFVGEFEAETKKEALQMAGGADYYAALCHQCSNDFELSDDPYKFDADEVQP